MNAPDISQEDNIMAIPVSRRLDFIEIPIIDMAELVAGNEDPATIDALRAGCSDVGFVYITNHGVPQNLIDDFLAASREFFARPMDEKKRVLVNERMRGYLPLRYSSYEGEENAAVSNQEGYWMGPDRPLNPENRLDGPNLWPEDGEALRSAMEAYHEAADALSVVLARAFSLALGQEPDFLSNLLNPVTQLLKVNHYPPQDNPTSVSDIGVVPHSDEGSFTILWQDENGGLEIETKSGEWVEAPPIHGTFVVNLGNMMQIWSNGEFSSTPHRVINRSGVDRYSIPLFSYARSDAPITPLLNGAEVDPDPDTCEIYQLKAWRRIFPIANTPEPV